MSDTSDRGGLTRDETCAVYLLATHALETGDPDAVEQIEIITGAHLDVRADLTPRVAQ